MSRPGAAPRPIEPDRPPPRSASMSPFRRLILLALLFGPVATPVGAQVVALRAARMLDVASGQIQSPGLVVVTGDRITAVGGAVPRGATIIDLGDVTLLPGLIDAH